MCGKWDLAGAKEDLEREIRTEENTLESDRRYGNDSTRAIVHFRDSKARIERRIRDSEDAISRLEREKEELQAAKQ